jgi:hypothetical protein
MAAQPVADTFVSLSPAKVDFVSRVAHASGLGADALVTWVLAENGPDNNPLNIGGGGAGYGSPQAAANATIAELRSARYQPVVKGYRTGGLDGFIAALSASPWDKCRYRGTNPNGSCADASPGALLRGVYARLKNPGSPGFGGTGFDPSPGNIAHNIGLAASDVGNIASTATGVKGPDVAGIIANTENWLASKALIVGGYFFLTLAAVALILLGVARATGAASAIGLRRASRVSAASEPGHSQSDELPF